jgi:hypothetical protein
MCEGDEKYIQKSMENIYRRDYIGDLVIDGRRVLQSILQDDVRFLQG